MSIFSEPKVDCHNHILDPARFPYSPLTRYHPAGHEIAPASQLLRVMDVYGVRRALVVGPNSGYGVDNHCLLDAIRNSGGRLKGVAVVDHGIATTDLASLKAQGIVGVAFNSANLGLEFYRDATDLIARLVDLDMFLQLQFERDQLLTLLDYVGRSPVRLLIDHCGRPDITAGPTAPAFQALLDLGRARRAIVKISGYAKFSRQPPLYEDAWPYIAAMVEAFTPDACVWGSDWPFIKAAERIDYGPLIALMETLISNPNDRRKVFWETPMRAFGFVADLDGNHAS